MRPTRKIVVVKLYFWENITNSISLIWFVQFYFVCLLQGFFLPFCCYESWHTIQIGKDLVLAMIIKLSPEFWRNQDIPEKFWKTYEQVKLDLLQNVLIIPDFIPSWAPTNHRMILLVILCFANLNGIFFLIS